MLSASLNKTFPSCFSEKRIQLYGSSAPAVFGKQFTLTCIVTRINFTGIVQFTQNNTPPAPSASVTQNVTSCQPSRSEAVNDGSRFSAHCADGTDSFTTVVKNYTLVISSVMSEDSGNWNCRLLNSSLSSNSLWLYVSSEYKLFLIVHIFMVGCTQ